MSQEIFAPEAKSQKIFCVVGEVDLDGTNPTPVTLPFENLVAVTLTIKRAVAPGAVETSEILTYGFSAGVLNIYAWGEVTTGGDPFVGLVAATDTATVSYVAYGY